MPTSVSKAMITDMFETLERARDELRVQAHLGKEDAKEEVQAQWERLEHKLTDAKSKRHQAFEALEDTGEGVLEGLKLTLDELSTGYKKFRDLI